MNKMTKLLRDNKQFIMFVALMCVFRSAVADWNTVPSGSMLPTIQIGDRIGINKLAYDIKMPFVNYTLKQLNNPSRGDIVVFESKAAGKRMVKRVIGLPGDTVAMVNNQVIVNGDVLALTQTDHSDNVSYYSEQIAGQSHTIALTDDRASKFDYFDTVTVPAGMYLVLGDNRRNSADSRVYGFIPRDEIIGQANNVVVSFNYDNYYIPRSDRIWQSLI